MRDRAAYMRAYRKRKKMTVAEVRIPGLDPLDVARSQIANTEAAFWEVTAENERLKNEVARLKRELAPRPAETARDRHAAYREFRPVPKPGKGK